MAVLGSGYNTRGIFDAYRKGYVSRGRSAPTADRFAYLGLVSVAASEKKARERAEVIASYLRTGIIVAPEFRNPPGYLTAEDNMRLLKGQTPPRTLTKDGRKIVLYTASVQELIDAGVMFCGTPDQVYEQISEFCDYCGGIGNLLMMGHAGALSHDETVDNLTVFAKEVLPRLKAYRQPDAESSAAA